MTYIDNDEELAVKSRPELRREQQAVLDRIEELENEERELDARKWAIDEEIQRLNDRYADIEDALLEEADGDEP